MNIAYNICCPCMCIEQICLKRYKTVTMIQNSSYSAPLSFE